MSIPSRWRRFPVLTLSLLLALAAPLFAEPEKLPEPVRVEVPTPAYQRYLDVVAQTQSLLEAGDIDGLEKLADELRTSKETLDAGTWLLSTFYQQAIQVPDDTPSEEKAAMDFYTGWAEKHPDNITAQICLAHAYVSYAWNARGSGYSDTVTEEGWRLMRERLDLAWKTLETARKLPVQCPEWASAAQSVALGQNWDYDRYFDMIEAALAKEPTYGAYYTQTCYWLLPRWHGETGDFEQWIAEQADKKPGREGDIAYAHLVWMAANMPVQGELVFGPDRLDWPRTKRGFTYWLEDTPGNLMVQSMFAWMALRAEDRETARGQFEAMGGNYSPVSWGTAKRFEQARQAAYFNGKNPYTVAFKPGGHKLDAGKIALVERIMAVVAGILGGLLIGIFCWILAWQRGKTLVGGLFFLACLIAGSALSTFALLLPSLAFAAWLLRLPPSGIDPSAPAPEPPNPWGTLALLVVLGVIFYIGLQAIATLVALMGSLLSEPNFLEHQDKVEMLVYGNGSAMRIYLNAAWITLLAAIVFCGKSSTSTLNARFALVPCPIWLPPAFLAAGAALGGVSEFLEQRFADPQTLTAMDSLQYAIAHPFLLILMVVVGAPVVEELIFRGFGFRGMLEKWGFPATALATSLIFTSLHVQYGWFGLLEIFVIGLILAAIRYRTGSIWPCIAFHMGGNGIATAAQFLQ